MARGQKGGYLSSESAVIVVGPAKLRSTSIGSTVPVGMVQSFQIQQSRAGQQIFEIGGRLPFNIPGRSSIQGSISRILFDGPSLAYALYAAGISSDGKSYLVPVPNEFGGETKADEKGFAAHNQPTLPYLKDVVTEGSGNRETMTITSANEILGVQGDNPGKLWLNLASALFNKPFGMGLVLYDMQGDVYGAVYLEDCVIRSHNFGIQANQTVLAESVSFSASRVVPVDATTITTAAK